MADVTFLTIQSDVRSYLDEALEGDWTDTEINRWINQGYHQVVTAAVETFEDYYLSQHTKTDSVGDQQEYTLPSDFYKMRRVEINYDVDSANSEPQRARRIDIDEVRTQLENTDVGGSVLRCAAYYVIGDRIGFIPIPDKTGTDAIAIWYVKQVADMTTSTETPDIPYPDRYWHLISFFAAAKGLRKGQQESTEADKLEAQLERGLKRMKEELEDRISEDGKRVIDTSGENVDFSAV